MTRRGRLWGLGGRGWTRSGIRRGWVGGTIVRGEVCGVAALKAYHLGLDEGPWVVRNLYGGNPAYGFMLTHAGRVGVVRGTHFEDISVLTNGMENQHSVIVEGQDEVTVQGLWIWTQGGTHGLVIKSSHATVRDFHCKGASSECLIVKSDAATDGAGYAADVLVDGVEISAMKTEGDTGGIEIDSRWDSVERLRLEHVTGARDDVRDQGVGIVVSYVAGSDDSRLDGGGDGGVSAPGAGGGGDCGGLSVYDAGGIGVCGMRCGSMRGM